MYGVYTSERPGRPGLAAVLSAGLLLVTVALAAGLIRYKRRAAQVPLAAPVHVESWPLAVRLPEGWKQDSLEEAPSDVGLVAREPGGSGRALAVVRGPTLDAPIPVALATEELGEVIGWLGSGTAVRRVPLGTMRFGPVTGAVAQWVVMQRTRTVVSVLGCAGVTPDGQVFALLLRSGQEPGAADRQLLKHLAAAVEITDLPLTDDVAGAASACGLRLDAPAGARALRPADGPVRTLTLLSDADADESWQLEVTVLPLAEGRKPAAVFADILRNMLEKVELDEELQPADVNGRQVFYAELSVPPHIPSIVLWLVPLTEQTAVVLHGRGEGPGSGLQEAGRKIAASLAPADGGLPLDIAAARRRGVEILETVREQKVDAWFEAWARSDGLYLLQHREVVRGFRSERYSRSGEAPDGVRWRVETDERWDLPGERSIVYKAEATLSADATSYTITAHRRDTWGEGRRARRRAVAFQYREQRSDGSAKIDRRLWVGRDQYKTAPSVDAAFACDPLLPVVYLEVAREAERGPAIVTTADWFESGLITQFVYPLGKRRLRADDESPSGNERMAVLVQTDSHLEPYTVFFDDDGTVAAIELGRRIVSRKCTPEEFRETFSLAPEPARRE